MTGVESEIKKYWKNDADVYKEFIRSVVEKEPIREEYKDQILRTMRMIEYKEKMILVFTLKSTGSAVRITTRYDKLAASFTAFVYIAAILIFNEKLLCLSFQAHPSLIYFQRCAGGL